MPHARIIGAAIVSALASSLGLIVVILIMALFIGGTEPTGTLDDAPERVLGMLLFLGVPVLFLLVLIIGTPLTYVAWCLRPVPRKVPLVSVVGASLAVSIPLAYVLMLDGPTFHLIVWDYILMVVMIFVISFFVFGCFAAVWWHTTPRTLTTRSSRRREAARQS